MNSTPSYSEPESSAARCSVVVCRGCCCGTTRKHPTVDHEVQLDRLRDLAAGDFRLRVVDCLGPCADANVVVVGPSVLGRLAGGRPQWIGRVLDEQPVIGIMDWIRRGGPGIVDAPDEVDAHIMPAPRREPRK